MGRDTQTQRDTAHGLSLQLYSLSLVWLRQQCIRMPSKRKRISLREAVRMIEDSDVESFEEDDNDRDSLYEPSDKTSDDEFSDKNVSVAAIVEASVSVTAVSATVVPGSATVATAADTTTAVTTAAAATPRSSSSLAATPDDASGGGWQPMHSTYVAPSDIAFIASPGMSFTLPPDAKPIDFFSQFLTEDIVKCMVTETNRYAEQFLETNELKPQSRMRRWSPTDVTEMKHFVAILFIMGLVKKPAIEDYWTTVWPIATPCVNSIMPRDRFELLLKFWHFSDNEKATEGDRLQKLRPVCDALLLLFQQAFTPGKELSIDESMVLWRGRLVFRQYIPGKRHKYGVKLYLLSDPSGYVLDALIYCGKSDISAGMGHADAVVMKLMENRLDLGHELYMDNFYNSIPLAKLLLQRKTLVCGTLRRNRKFLPKTVVEAKLKRGECVRQRNGRIVVAKWHDNRDVLMLSTFHTGQLTDTGRNNRRGERIFKPDCVLGYNRSMCGVDRVDQLTAYYTPLRKTLRWYKKVVLHFLDMAMTNAFLLYRMNGGKHPQKWFRLQVIMSLMAQQDREAELAVPALPAAGAAAATGNARPVPFFRHKSSDMSRLTGQHYPDVLSSTPGKTAAMRRCVVCHKQGRRKETRYFCETCIAKPALCITPCFKVYHTEEHL